MNVKEASMRLAVGVGNMNEPEFSISKAAAI
jgi:hypothetical protein